MQEAVPKGEGGMLAILGSDIDSIDKILKENEKNFECFIANDNSDHQLVVSGSSENVQKFSDFLRIVRYPLFSRIKFFILFIFSSSLSRTSIQNNDPHQSM